LPGERRHVVSVAVVMEDIGVNVVTLWCSGKEWRADIFGNFLIFDVGMATIGTSIIGGCLGRTARELLVSFLFLDIADLPLIS
jgi:hypothetical protein